ncbi:MULTISPECIES: hypothetical protein [Chromobacterium]|uniref:Type 1 fimbrial protein n=1 Tax=Chromobacterium haemolyticum TaxID=394935 RepID=A0A1W0D7X7_9NEIS|nr:MULTISPECIES: hypothetical protein [Chromobacterium]OQS43096.1 hypothetical protein B0T45_03765 [Chromobacterium haemolyticum]QOZ83966.1 hypothetical protein DXT74_13370 [Chromobacterium sp. Rain0013]UGA37340.1 hypothetical protein JOS77_25370 [Chromobacterium haemolyticum]WON84112.1 hypothetical protein OK026_00945 [Chromobacterium haemolyticum]
MNKFITTLAALAAMQSGLTLAAQGGVIGFSGAIVKEPCAQEASTLVRYSSHPQLYQAARKISSGPTCSGMDNTQSVTISNVKTSQFTEGQIVTVVYN